MSLYGSVQPQWTTFNGGTVIPSSNCVSATSEELKSHIKNSIMPPRLGMDSLSKVAASKNVRFAVFHGNVKGFSSCPSHLDAHIDPVCRGENLSVDPLVPRKPVCSVDGHPSKSHGNSYRMSNNTEFATRRADYRRRLELCAKRLKDVRTNASNVLSRIVSSNLPSFVSPCTCVIPSTISRMSFDDETESSTDDESCPSQTNVCSDEENWLSTRAIVFSHWYWLVSEMKRSRKSLDNLRIIKSSYRRWKAEFPPQFTSTEEGCSRTTPFNRITSRRPLHDLGASKCAQLISKIRSHSVDRSIRCSCIPPFSGPCILCCSSVPNVTVTPDAIQNADLLPCALPLAGHIHPKLSLPGDIQLSLRLESRLAASPNVVFREHKTTTRSLSPSEKPTFLRMPQSILPIEGLKQLEDHPITNISGLHSQSKNRRNLQRHLFSVGVSRRSRNNMQFRRLCNKSSSGPSALRRILDLSPDGDQLNTNKSWQQPLKMEEQ